MRINFVACIIGLFVLFTSCDINSTDSESEAIDVQPQPDNAGTVNLIGNQLRAEPEAGYFFQYWKINHTDGTISTVTNDSTLIEQENIERIKGVFGAIEVESSAHLKTGKNKENVYFISSFRMPVDTATSKKVYAFVKYDVSKATKQKVFISEK